MKKVKFLMLAIGFLFVIAACNVNSKSDTWSKEQEAKWKEGCMELMMENNIPNREAEGVCDCIFEKTSEKYTPEEAANITEEEEQKIWQACDYQF